MPPPAPPGQYDMSDDEFDEIVSGDEDVKPDLNDVSKLLRGQLREPRFKTTFLKQLFEMVHTGTVDLDPIYQRDVVWPESKQIGLIQSLFMNYYVPPVIFAADTNPETGEQTLVCIDGKQRCTSVVNFMGGKIPFKAGGENYYYTSHPGQKKNARPLPNNLKRRFDMITIQVVEYDEITMEQQRDIFQRVQLGVALTTAEKMQAISGPWVDWLRMLQSKYVLADGGIASKLLNMDTKRARAFQNLASFIVMAHDPNRKKAPAASTINALLGRTDEPERPFARKVEMALGIFVDIATQYYDDAFGSQAARVAPVEFMFISLLIFQRMSSMSVQRLARTIADMRDVVRTELIDIRANSTTVNKFYEYLDFVPRTKQPGEVAAAENYDEEEHDTARDRRMRKRRRDEEEQDGTYLDHGPRRDERSAVIGGLRSRDQQARPSSSQTTQRPALPVAPPPQIQPVQAVRPPPLAMDAPVSAPPSAQNISAPPPAYTPQGGYGSGTVKTEPSDHQYGNQYGNQRGYNSNGYGYSQQGYSQQGYYGRR